MPITVTCTCGKRFRAKDEHAGRRGRCPSCGAAITIPKGPAPGAPPGPGAGAPRSAPRASGSTRIEAGVGTTCPSCNRPLASGAVLCVNCGHDTRLGRKTSSSVRMSRRPSRRDEIATGDEPEGWSLTDDVVPYRDWTWLIPVFAVMGAVGAITAGVIKEFITIHEGLAEGTGAQMLQMLTVSAFLFGGAIVGAYVGRLFARFLPK